MYKNINIIAINKTLQKSQKYYIFNYIFLNELNKKFHVLLVILYNNKNVYNKMTDKFSEKKMAKQK